MEFALFVYLAHMAEQILLLSQHFAFFAAVGVLILTGSYIFAWIEECENLSVKSLKFLKVFCTLLAIAISITIFVPSKSTMYMMAGGYAVQEFYSNDTGSKVMAIINQELDKMIEVEK